MMRKPARRGLAATLAGAATALLIAAAPGGVALAQAPTATYTVTFDATWSAATHPQDFPGNPHFSWIVGGTHDATASFWEVGGTASLGIRRMAEWGATTPLDEEVEAAIALGQADQVILGDLIDVSPGAISHTFTASADFPLVTLVSMIAPSPDWFVGVSGLDLLAGGDWVEQVVVELWPHDAGTDSGQTYVSPNQPTSPQAPIAQITGAPFTPGAPIGTFTFTRQAPVSDVPAAGGLAVRSYPNPFNPRTPVAYAIPAPGRLRIAVHDLRGRPVRVLLDRRVDAGEGRVSWDGRDRRGRAAAAGTYLLLTEALGRSVTRRITLVK